MTLPSRPSSPSAPAPPAPPTAQRPRRPTAWRVHGPRLVASALLLLGGGLGGGLLLSWWHYTQLDGSPFTNPSDTGAVILAVTFGLDDGVCAVVAWDCGGRRRGGTLVAAPAAARYGVVGTIAGSGGGSGRDRAGALDRVGVTDAPVRTVHDIGYIVYTLARFPHGQLVDL